MTLDETKKVLAYIASAYPRYFTNVTIESAKRQTIPWHDALGEYSTGAVMAGVKSYISADSSGFPPTPGQIIHYIHFTGHPVDPSGTEAWSLVRKAVNCPWDHMEAAFQALPGTVRKAVGSAASLKELAMMDTQRFETVAQSNFLRMYDTAKKREATEQRLPASAIAARGLLQAELDSRHRNTFGLPQEDHCREIEDKLQEASGSEVKKKDLIGAPADKMKELRQRLASSPH